MAKSMWSAEVAKTTGSAATIESVADILECEHQHLIEDWLARVEKEPDLTCIPLNFKERTGHLPQLMRDVIARLRLDSGTKAPVSEAAGHHGDLRRKQGYTVAMEVEVEEEEYAVTRAEPRAVIRTVKSMSYEPAHLRTRRRGPNSCSDQSPGRLPHAESVGRLG
jgi:hypothetical protein